MKRKMLAAAVFIALLGCIYIFSQNPVQKTPERIKAIPEEIIVPKALEANQETAAPAAEPVQGGSVTLELSPNPNLYTSSAQPQPEVSYSLKRNNSEREIMPGVTYKSGEGINMAVDEDEKIQIRRDSTYQSNQYQVMWKKNF